MEYASKLAQPVEIKLLLHPADHRRVLNAARQANMSEREFFALAVHLGTAEILQSVRQF